MVLVTGSDDRKVTPGVTELSGVRVHIDRQACFLDVGSSYPGVAEGAKGGAVRPLKGNVSGLWMRVATVIHCPLKVGDR